jgi:siroheme synthase (precorrin-2 oxidase/ferrochelatase)
MTNNNEKTIDFVVRFINLTTNEFFDDEDSKVVRFFVVSHIDEIKSDINERIKQLAKTYKAPLLICNCVTDKEQIQAFIDNVLIEYVTKNKLVKKIFS